MNPDFPNSNRQSKFLPKGDNSLFSFLCAQLCIPESDPGIIRKTAGQKDRTAPDIDNARIEDFRIPNPLGYGPFQVRDLVRQHYVDQNLQVEDQGAVGLRVYKDGFSHSVIVDVDPFERSDIRAYVFVGRKLD